MTTPAPQIAKTTLLHSAVEVKASPVHGYGVFATKDFNAAELIEECPVLIFNRTAKFPPNLFDRLFSIDSNYCCLPLGNGAIYNHAAEPNAHYVFNADNELLCFTAIAPIKKGEEIFIDYGKNYFGSRFLGQQLAAAKKSNRSLWKTILIFLIVLLLSYFVSLHHRAIISPVNTKVSSQPDPFSFLFNNLSSRATKLF